MMKEILINFVLLPTLDSITEPEYVNQTISWLCEDAALNNEAFLMVVKTTENVEELEAVKAKVWSMDKWKDSRQPFLKSPCTTILPS